MSIDAVPAVLRAGLLGVWYFWNFFQYFPRIDDRPRPALVFSPEALPAATVGEPCEATISVSQNVTPTGELLSCQRRFAATQPDVWRGEPAGEQRANYRYAHRGRNVHLHGQCLVLWDKCQWAAGGDGVYNHSQSVTRGYTPLARMAFGYTNEYQRQGLIYLRARMYAPADGQFLTRDTWAGDVNRPGSLSRWGYTTANPVNLIDPSGHDAGCSGRDCSIPLPPNPIPPQPPSQPECTSIVCRSSQEIVVELPDGRAITIPIVPTSAPVCVAEFWIAAMYVKEAALSTFRNLVTIDSGVIQSDAIGIISPVKGGAGTYYQVRWDCEGLWGHCVTTASLPLYINGELTAPLGVAPGIVDASLGFQAEHNIENEFLGGNTFDMTVYGELEFFKVGVIQASASGYDLELSLGGQSPVGGGSYTWGVKVGILDRATLFGRAKTFRSLDYQAVGYRYLGRDYLYIGDGAITTDPYGFLQQNNYFNWQLMPVHERMPQNFRVIDPLPPLLPSK